MLLFVGTSNELTQFAHPYAVAVAVAVAVADAVAVAVAAAVLLLFRYLSNGGGSLSLSTLQEPTTRRKERKREFTIARVDDRFSFLSV